MGADKIIVGTFLVGLCPADISLNHELHQKSVRNERAACSGTMQITKGLGIPNKHFAKQNGVCIDRRPACYNCVSSERLYTLEENHSYRYQC